MRLAAFQDVHGRGRQRSKLRIGEFRHWEGVPAQRVRIPEIRLQLTADRGNSYQMQARSNQRDAPVRRVVEHLVQVRGNDIGADLFDRKVGAAFRGDAGDEDGWCRRINADLIKFEWAFGHAARGFLSAV